VRSVRSYAPDLAPDSREVTLAAFDSHLAFSLRSLTSSWIKDKNSSRLGRIDSSETRGISSSLGARKPESNPSTRLWHPARENIGKQQAEEDRVVEPSRHRRRPLPSVRIDDSRRSLCIASILGVVVFGIYCALQGDSRGRKRKKERKRAVSADGPRPQETHTEPAAGSARLH